MGTDLMLAIAGGGFGLVGSDPVVLPLLDQGLDELAADDDWVENDHPVLEASAVAPLLLGPFGVLGGFFTTGDTAARWRALMAAGCARCCSEMSRFGSDIVYFNSDFFGSLIF
jgi:hypothetical protein